MLLSQLSVGGHTGLALACLKKINGEVTFVVLENDFLTKIDPKAA